DLPLQSRGHQNGARQGQEFAGIDRLPAGEVAQALAVVDMARQSEDVQPARIVNGAVTITGAENLYTALVQLVAGDRPDVAETLDDDGRFLRFDLQFLHRLHDAIGHSASGGLLAADAAAEFDRLAGDDFRARIADLHAVRVVNPRHRLLVG